MVHVSIKYDDEAQNFERLQFSVREEEKIKSMYFCVKWKQQDWIAIENFINGLEKLSDRASRLKRDKNFSQLRIVNGSAKRSIERIGKRLFKLLKEGGNFQGKSFDNVFGKELDLFLELDDKIPWELLLARANKSEIKSSTI